jgi:glycyl-tRNA synthetase
MAKESDKINSDIVDSIETKNRSNIERLKILLVENQYITPSFDLYGGQKGFHDYGVMGFQVKNKLINLWREFFLFEDDIEEIECPTIMPYNVLKASGHVDRFQDYVVFDHDGKCYRADHLLENYFRDNGMNDLVNKVASWSAKRMAHEINKFDIIKGPVSKEDKTVNLQIEVKSTNLMFEVVSNNSNNPHGIDFLRPELAQGIFINFKRINDFNKRELPFGVAQVGKSYRKEISTTPFTRMREFTQAEIEFFIDPKDPSYDKIAQYMTTSVPLLPSLSQETGSSNVLNVTIGEALEKGLINHQTMAYFIVRIFEFSKLIGLDMKKIRFRQHMDNEMAHYANQCWDLECYVNERWLECVGIADRGSYDLHAHSNNLFGSNGSLMMKKKRRSTKVTTKLIPRLNMGIIGKKYREDAKNIADHINSMNQDKLREIKEETFSEKESMYIFVDGVLFSVDKNMLKIEEQIIKDEFEEFYPSIVEPSIGIDRIMYSIFEHNFWIRQDDDQRIVMSLPQEINPYDIAILPLHKKDTMINKAMDVFNMLKNEKYKCYRDNSGVKIGKKYSRLDEMGVKYAITVDPGSLEDNKVTIRERDSMNQIRIPINNLIKIMKDIDTYF